MKNLVIGSAGFIGTSFCQYLTSQGEEVVEFDIKNGSEQDARVAKIDFTGIDYVYFLAWDVGGAKYLYKDDVQIQQLEWNTTLMTNVMSQLQKSGVPFLFISSQLAEEQDTVYGATKRLGEVWTRILGGVFVRQWNVYGPIEENSIRSHVVSDFVHQAVTTGEIRMLTTGEERRQFIHIDDVCSAWHAALHQKLQGKHDVTSFEWVSVRSVADMIAAQTQAVVIPGTKVGSTPLTPMSGKIPNWDPKVKLDDGLARMVAEAKKNI